MGTTSCTASQNGLSSLYHYTPFCEERLSDILTNNRVFCSNPSNFNDPWDGKPYFEPDIQPDSRAKTAEFFIAHQEGGLRQKEDERLRSDPDYLTTVLERLNKEFPIFLSDQFRVFCLSSNSTNTLLWSHYARNHTGLCLEFEVGKGVFAFALGVHYQKGFPRLVVYEGFEQFLLIKSEVWKHEEEYRLICARLPRIANTPLALDGDYLKLPAHALRSIIIGCQSNAEAIRGVVSKHLSSVPVRRALRSPSSYELVIS